MDHLLGFDPLPWLDRLRRARTALAEAVRGHRSAQHRDRGTRSTSMPMFTSIPLAERYGLSLMIVDCAGKASDSTCRWSIAMATSLNSSPSRPHGSRTSPCNSSERLKEMSRAFGCRGSRRYDRSSSAARRSPSAYPDGGRRAEARRLEPARPAAPPAAVVPDHVADDELRLVLDRFEPGEAVSGGFTRCPISTCGGAPSFIAVKVWRTIASRTDRPMRCCTPVDRDDPQPPDRRKCCQIRMVFCGC